MPGWLLGSSKLIILPQQLGSQEYPSLENQKCRMQKNAAWLSSEYKIQFYVYVHVHVHVHVFTVYTVHVHVHVHVHVFNMYM